MAKQCCAVGVVILVLLTACGGGGPVAAPTVTVTATVRETVTETETKEITIRPSRPTSEPDDDETGGGIVTTSASEPPLAPGRTLRLNDFFGPSSEWSEGRYDVADRTDIRGITNVISDCDPSESNSLELRLQNQFDRLTFEVGQSNDSTDSDLDIIVEVIANGDQVESRQIPFNFIQSFDIDVRDVNALIVQFRLGTCTSSRNTTAVLIDPTLE